MKKKYKYIKTGLLILFSIAILANYNFGKKELPELSIHRLTCEGINNPIGIDIRNPKLGWQIKCL